MSQCPENLLYTRSHEWLREEGDVIVVGITDHAQGLLGDLVFVEMPEVDSHIDAGDECGVVESVKAASDIYAPVSGTITAINDALADAPEQVNSNPYQDGWLFKVKPDNFDTDKAELLSTEEYQQQLEEEA